MKPIIVIAFLIIANSFSPMTEKLSQAALGHEIQYIAATKMSPSPYLFVWAGDEDQKEPDFLAVIDARPGEPSYGQVVATLPIGARATTPHHTEYEFPEGSNLFANGWAAGRTFIIDLSNPRNPRLAGQITQAADYAFPHSFARLANGNVLATFQVKKKGYEPPGGLVELDPRGRVVRATSADVPGFAKNLLWPYSLTVLPEIDRVVMTSTEMGLPKWALPDSHRASPHAHTLTDTNHIQIWSLSDLRLLATVPLPPPPQGKSHLNPAEPRVLPDGTVYVNTFNCGLFRVLGLEGSNPKAEFVYSFPGADKTGLECAVPVVFEKFWIQTDPSLPGLIALDVSNPAAPREVSRVVFDKRFSKTHWIAADRSASRLVVTGNDQSWVLIVNIDMRTGKLTLDETFKEKGGDHPGLNFDRRRWPHGATGKAVVHGALFGRGQ
ncbi:MAG TPA: selenium-binding protein SBP56-related protein [Pyrinomonadaceae bacterium]|nr:selenium-binding protein SBP56-related protein [Pyrinomonadaceae bacterium]